LCVFLYSAAVSVSKTTRLRHHMTCVASAATGKTDELRFTHCVDSMLLSIRHTKDMIPQIFTVTSEHIRFYFFSFSVFRFLVVVSVR